MKKSQNRPPFPFASIRFPADFSSLLFLSTNASLFLSNHILFSTRFGRQLFYIHAPFKCSSPSQQPRLHSSRLDSLGCGSPDRGRNTLEQQGRLLLCPFHTLIRGGGLIRPRLGFSFGRSRRAPHLSCHSLRARRGNYRRYRAARPFAGGRLRL